MSEPDREKFEFLVGRLAFDFRSETETETLHKAIIGAYDTLQAKVREYHEKYVHQDLLFAEQDKVRELEEALRAVSSVGRNILKPKFDHCGFMNATQLGNRDAVLHMLKQVERALEGERPLTTSI